MCLVVFSQSSDTKLVVTLGHPSVTGGMSCGPKNSKNTADHIQVYIFYCCGLLLKKINPAILRNRSKQGQTLIYSNIWSSFKLAVSGPHVFRVYLIYSTKVLWLCMFVFVISQREIAYGLIMCEVTMVYILQFE